jgi:transcription antitermination factor NusG
MTMSHTDLSPRWFVAVTRPRVEARIAEAMKAKDLTTYLPVERVKRVCRSGRRTIKRELILPLFPSYLFIRLPFDAGLMEVREVRLAFDAELMKIRAIEGVEGMVGGLDGRPSPLPINEIKRIRMAEAAGKFDQVVSPRELTPGEVLEVCHGPFLGYRAAYLSPANGDRINVLMRAAGEEHGGFATQIPVGDLVLLAA